MAAFLIAACPATGANVTAFTLLGCWKQTSPFSAKDIPPGKEWGERTWCFRDGGRLDTWNIACGAGCDGWDGQFAYRYHGLMVELQDYEYDEKGNQSEIWQNCRIDPVKNDRFILRDCPQSEHTWIRTEDPEPEKSK
jgi:hypothetical protein